MSESARRRGYTYNRVLIESARILAPQFNDAVVFLTGAQLEMLRNVTQYLNRKDTYVEEYSTEYYIVPDDEDFDSIIEIVADMEETLMGNPNVIWGYADTWAEEVYIANAPAGNNTLASAVVPAGYVYVLSGMTTLNGLTITTQWHDMILSSVTCRMGVYTAVGAGVTQPTFPINAQLKEGDYARGVFLACTLNDNLYVRFWGYKMVVPE